MEKKEPYLRWHEVKADAPGTFRGADSEMFADLNRRTMEKIQENAEQENLR